MMTEPSRRRRARAAEQRSFPPAGIAAVMVLLLLSWASDTRASHDQPGYENLVRAGEAEYSQIKLRYPDGAYKVVSRFGDKWSRLAPRPTRRRNPHAGIDIRAPEGTPVLAPAPGVIVATYWMGEGGNTIWMRTTLRGEEISFYFLHLTGFNVENGDRVKAGDIIGWVGGTIEDHKKAIPHLHFEVARDDGWYDPAAFLRSTDGYVECVEPGRDYSDRPWSSASLNHPWLLYPVACTR